MAVDRIDPPYVAGERALLEAFLDYHRATLLRKCEGLSDEQLTNASAPPSAISLIGLVRHLTEVKRNWVRRNGHADLVRERIDGATGE